MSTLEVAEALRLALGTVYRLIDEGALPAYRFGRVIRLKRKDVNEFIERSRINARLTRQPPHRRADDRRGRTDVDG